MNVRDLIVISLGCTLVAAGCESNKETPSTDASIADSAQAEATPPGTTETDAPETPDAEPQVQSVEVASFEMKHMPEPPEELVETTGDGVVLTYTNFPGYFEVFDESTVKDCILAYEEEPFDVTFMRYTYADEDAFTRAVKIDACPELEGEQLARQWLDAERLRDGFADSPATGVKPPYTESGNPSDDAAGWAGRGFYRVGDGEQGEGPSEQEWKTFCGSKSGTPCDKADWKM